MTETTLDPKSCAYLRPDQRQRFEEDGYLVVPNALPPDLVQRLVAAIDRLEAAGKLEAQPAQHTRHMRNCIVEDDAFLPLLDWHATFPLVVDILSWNIKLITSHVICRDPSPADAPDTWKSTGWHRDGGTSAQEMAEPHPRLYIKIAYWLTDLSEPGRGNLRVLPGSHRLTGRPAQADGAPDPYGAVELCARPGDAVLFEQRTWHAVGPNRVDYSRKSVFIGYAYRWIQPMDYVAMPDRLLHGATPIQRQLLGDARTQLGFYLPTDDDAPLRQWVRDREAHLKAHNLR